MQLRFLKLVFLVFILSHICVYGQEKETPQWIQLTLQGEEFVRQRNYKQAVEMFSQAARIQKKSTRLYMNLAISYSLLCKQALGKEQREEYYDLHLTYAKRTLALDPLHKDARFLLDTHLGIIPKPVLFKEEKARTYYVAGKEALGAGALKAAAEMFEKGLAIERHPDILKSLGVIEFSRQKYEKAAGYLNKSLKHDQVQHDAYMLLGEISERRKQLSEAKQFYIKALAAYPHYFSAREKISLVNKKMGKEGTFFVLVDPVPVQHRGIQYDDMTRLRKLSEELKVNIFQLQCWLVYHGYIRTRKEDHKKILPKITFEISADIETDAVSHMLGFYIKNKERMGVALKQFDILIRLKGKGLLKPAVFFYRWRDDFSRDFVRYRENHFESMCKMLEEHL